MRVLRSVRLSDYDGESEQRERERMIRRKKIEKFEE